MTYTPTIPELEDMGFTNNSEFPSIYIYKPEESERFSNTITYSFVTKYFYIWDSFIYPDFKNDIETLIRLFTQP